MIKKVNLQYLLSYLGILPIVIIAIDDLFFKNIPISISNDFLIYYLIVIFVFIGAMNWNLSKEVPSLVIFNGFLPSITSVFLIILNLLTLNKELILIIIILFLLFQLSFDYIIVYKSSKKIFFLLRLPLTFLICILVIFISIL